jgi:hypothetical protein
VSFTRAGEPPISWLERRLVAVFLGGRGPMTGQEDDGRAKIQDD